MKHYLLGFLLAGFAGTIAAQPAKIEIKDVSGYGQGKFKRSPKKIFIAQFRVNYQLLFSQEEVSQGGRQLGGGYRGDVKAGLTMAIKGVSAVDLQETTDRLYNDYVARLKSAGYEILSADAAAGAKAYDGWERKTGGTLNEAQYPGFITGVPTGYEYYVKKTKEDGREKGSFTDNTLKISDQIDATVIKVNLVIPFVEDAESGASKALGKTLGGMAKVVLRPYLRLEKDPAGTAGTFSTDAAQTKVTYGFQESMGQLAISYLCLKDDVPMPGIFEDKKYKAVETADTDLWGTDVGALTIFNVSDKYLAMTQPLPCDPNQYKEAIYNVCNKYLETTFADFQSYMK